MTREALWWLEVTFLAISHDFLGRDSQVRGWSNRQHFRSWHGFTVRRAKQEGFWRLQVHVVLLLFPKKKKKASEPFSGDRELRAEWLMQPQTLLLLLAHLLSKYLWVRWAQNVLKKMSGYLWIFCSYHLSKAARNCFQMAPERCLSFIKRKKAAKLPRKELDVPDRMTECLSKHLDT